MSPRLTASALFGLGLVVMTAIAQPPVGIPITRGDKKAVDKAAEKKADPLDGLIGAALLHDADVQVARAKVQLAEAELTKARQVVTMKVTTLSAAIEDQKRAVAMAKQVFDIAEAQYKNKISPLSEVIPARDKYEASKSKLAQLETELKLVTGGGMKAAAGWDDLDKVHRGTAWNVSCMACHGTPVGKGATDPAVRAGLDWLGKHQAGSSPDAVRASDAAALLAAALREPVTGPIADRIRAALDKPVKLGVKGQRLTLQDAMEVFRKEAGLDVTLREQYVIDMSLTGQSSIAGQSMPVGAWLQLFADANPDGRILVRDYGLLVTLKEQAPPDAVTVSEFWKQKPEKKEPPKAVEGQPKR